MPQYLAPGVYVEEVPSAVQPIAGVGTSTAGFIGVVANDIAMPVLPGRTGRKADGTPEPNDLYKVAPAGVPQLVTSWAGFKNAFGNGILAGNNVLAHAVYGFFNNGGTRCWVTRVAAAGEAANALTAFERIDEIALVAISGDTTDATQNAILNHCANVNLQDRFAILDGRQTTTLTKAAIQGGTNDNSYGAIYFPWIQVFDPATNAVIAVPPSGHIAGIYARVDATRGVHKAPANEVIRGAVGVATVLSKADQAGLNPDDINVIRQFDGNVTVWGARTLAGREQPEWRYISARRLFLYLRESIDEGTQWVVFEPNDQGLWAKITRNVTAFLTNVWRDGALFGATPAEAFYVKCDAETNPPDVRALGQVVTEIGVALIQPAEFVVFRIRQVAGAGQ
jgi:phage tail sheath protein FI